MPKNIGNTMKTEKTDKIVSLEIKTDKAVSRIKTIRDSYNKDFNSLSACFNYIRKSGTERNEEIISEKKCNAVQTIAIKMVISNGWYDIFRIVNEELYKNLSKNPAITFERLILHVKKAIKSAKTDKIENLESFLRDYLNNELKKSAKPE